MKKYIHYNNRSTALMLCAALMLSALCACGGGETGAETVGGDTDTVVSLPVGGETRTPAEADLTGAAVITLRGSSAELDGSGAEISEGVITVTEGGTFVLSGELDDGRVIVNAPGEEVTLVLNGASIRCSYGSPLYVYKCSRTTVHLMAGTKNALADGESYTFADALSSAEDGEPNACIYSKADLTIQGAGELEVVGSYKNGISCKDALEIYDAVLTVSAENHGINGKDSNTIDSAAITVSCGGDAIRSTNDSDSALGWVSISNSVLDLTAGEDGIQAETQAAVAGSVCVISCGGGSGAELDEDTSAKGIKAGTDLSLFSGTYTLDCADDALHANGDVSIHDGSYTISSGDDGVHADGTLSVAGGQIEILSSYEGLEGTKVEISGGDIAIVASDDGVNAAGGSDGSGFGGGGMGGFFGSAGGDYAINISGGSLRVNAGGDGLDSNGSISMSGGTVLVSSSGTDDGAIDYETSFSLTGGVLMAASAGMMPATPTDPEQYTVSVSFDKTLSEGTLVCFSGGGLEFVFCPEVPAWHIVFSSPELVGGESYTVSYGGEYSGECGGVLCSGGEYSGGTLLAELTLSSTLTTYGRSGMGGMGGMGGWGGQNVRPGGRGEMPSDFNGELPSDFNGEMPSDFNGEMPSDFNGEMPSDFNGEMPSDFNGEMPSDFNGEMPSDFNGEMPPDFGGEMPPDFGGEAPPEEQGI